MAIGNSLLAGIQLGRAPFAGFADTTMRSLQQDKLQARSIESLIAERTANTERVKKRSAFIEKLMGEIGKEDAEEEAHLTPGQKEARARAAARGEAPEETASQTVAKALQSNENERMARLNAIDAQLEALSQPTIADQIKSGDLPRTSDNVLAAAKQGRMAERKGFKHGGNPLSFYGSLPGAFIDGLADLFGGDEAAAQEALTRFSPEELQNLLGPVDFPAEGAPGTGGGGPFAAAPNMSAIRGLLGGPQSGLQGSLGLAGSLGDLGP